MKIDEKKHNEISGKINKIRKIIFKEDISGILITRQYNICWLTAGANNHVLYDNQDGLIGILVTSESATVIAENGDHDRVRNEEFFHYPFEYRKINWYSNNVGMDASKMIKGGRLGVDAYMGGLDNQVNIDGHLMQFRSVLVDNEIERLRTYGKEASAIITKVAKETKPGIKEREIAAMLSEEFVANGFNVAVILIGGDERSLKYRHQVVTDKKVSRHYCFCGVGKKGGLTFPITRIVTFGKPKKELEENQKKIETVYVYLNSLVKIGTNLKSIFEKLPEIYSSAGLDRDEWKNHTQGGTMGYHPREQTVSEFVDYTLCENNVIGWNPSLPGLMAEDVYLLKKDGLEFITYDDNWPSMQIHANGLTQIRPSILNL